MKENLQLVKLDLWSVGIMLLRLANIILKEKLSARSIENLVKNDKEKEKNQSIQENLQIQYFVSPKKNRRKFRS